MRTITTTTICGNCDIPLDSHLELHRYENWATYELPDGSYCDRFEDEGYVLNYDTDPIADTDDYCSFTQQSIEVNSYIGTTSHDITHEDEWHSMFLNRETNPGTLGYWKDVEPDRCTHAIQYWTGNPGAQYPGNNLTKVSANRITGTLNNKHLPVTHKRQFSEAATYVQKYDSLDFEHPKLMDLEFTELQGFISSKLYDAEITEAYQYHFFNIFVGRDRNLHIGLLTFKHNSNLNTVEVTCKQSGCYYRSHKHSCSLDATRQEQEDFIHACIRHGNNHGPSWYTRREDFAYIHAENCDTFHTRQEFCNANKPLQIINFLVQQREDIDGNVVEDIYTLTAEEAQNLLIKHRKFCRSSQCRCTHYYHLLNARNHNRKVAA